ncbi:MAG: cryptochrome/photolyase family protein [Cyclobacteriaceae bacterium]
MEATLIFPHQLFKDHPAIQSDRHIYLIEEHLFFTQYRFHKQKLCYHRATMKAYQNKLEAEGYSVIYVEAHDEQHDVRKLISYLDLKTIHYVDPVDNYLRRRITESCNKLGISHYSYESPSFLNSKEEVSAYFKPDKKKYFQTDFYKQQRKKYKILLEEGDKPAGGKWSFDDENRKKYPKKQTPPSISFPDATEYYTEAVNYIEQYFSENTGSLTATPLYPICHRQSEEWFDQFLAQRFSYFGDYEDAIVGSESILHHSVLSPMLNNGLLTPDSVIDRILSYAEKHHIQINNTEGIIRQIIGWREFIRGVYIAKGNQERTTNYWRFTRKIPESFYYGTTGIPPIDITIKKLLKSGYSHHIERLMVLSNFMLLCEFDPDEVYRWFMELYIDAYDWVMVPNVYGMSQFADGGVMSTKPYISGSNYLIKMSDYKKGDWQATWDGLFWHFMDKQRHFFLSNPRLGMLIRTFDSMAPEKRESHLQNAKTFLQRLD